MIWVHLKQGSDAVNLSYICWDLLSHRLYLAHQGAQRCAQNASGAQHHVIVRMPSVRTEALSATNRLEFSLAEIKLLVNLNFVRGSILHFGDLEWNIQMHTQVLMLNYIWHIWFCTDSPTENAYFQPSVCLATICSLHLFQRFFDRNKRNPPESCCFSVVSGPVPLFFPFRHETQTEPESVQPEMSGWIWGVELEVNSENLGQNWRKWWNDGMMNLRFVQKKQLETAILRNSICMSIFVLLYIYIWWFIISSE